MPTSGSKVVLRAVGVLLAALGCVICAVLVRLSMPMEGSHRLFGADVCAPTAAVNCDYVLSSGWAKIGPIPTATLGLAYFWAVGMWYLLVGPPNYRGRWWHLLPLVTVSLGFCGSLGFMYLLVFRLPVWCTWCVAAHIVNAFLLVLTLLGWPRRPTPASEPGQTVAAYPSSVRAGSVLGASVSLLLMILLGSTLYRVQAEYAQLWRKYSEVTNNAEYIAWKYRSAPQRVIPIRPDDPALGAADAPSTLVVFSDFECAKCASLFLSLPHIADSFPGKLRIVFKQFPLDSACNPDAPRGFHFHSCAAALAAEAVHSLGDARQSLDYHRLLYQNMTRFGEGRYARLAVEAGLDVGRFDAVLAARAGRERLEEDLALGRELGVRGTPALFLNGRELSTWMIIKENAAARFNKEGTLALWEILLGETAKNPASATSKRAG